MDMQDAVEFIRETGLRGDLKLKLYALSTCAFCRRAIEFLKSHEFEFDYIYLDKIDVETKREIKANLKEKYKNLPVFPVLTIKDEEAISGFREEEYRKALEISDNVAGKRLYFPAFGRECRARWRRSGKRAGKRPRNSSAWWQATTAGN